MVAASLLRAAATAAALVASSAPLSVNENGTYYTTVLLGSKSVKMGVDMRHFGIWVSCRVFEDDQCDVGVSGYPQYPYTSTEYGTLTFKEVTIAGQVLKDRDVFVSYDPLGLSDKSFQGYIGLRGQDIPDDLPPLGKGANVSSIALQLGTSSNDSVLSFNSIDQTLLEAKQLTTKTTVDARVSCFRMPVARSNTTVDDCTFTPGSSNYQVTFDSNSNIIQLEYTTLRKLEDRFVGSCSKVYEGSSYSTNWYGYTCNATMKLPRLMVQMSAYEFYLDPVDYTAPANATTAGVPQVRVLIGGSSSSESWILGKPFLRKFPIMFNTTARFTTQYYNLYCTANSTCRNVPTRTINSNYGTSGGGGGGGGGGTSSDYDIDVSARRKRNKLYLSIGLGVGGVVLLGIFGWICKCCKDANKDDDEDKEGGEKGLGVEDATGEVTIALTTGSGESSDRGDKEKEKKDGGETLEAKAVKPSGQKKTRSKRVVDSSSDSSGDSDGSSDYDSESSEERRRERRRRRRRRERRRERKEKEATEASKTSGDPEETETETHYVATTTPRAANVSS